MTLLKWHGQLASIGLRVDDVERSVRFYEDVLGMVRSAAVAGGESVWLGWGTDDAVLEFSSGSPALTHIALEVPVTAELEGLRARLERDDVTASARDDGGFAVLDPEGRELRFTGRVARPGEAISSAGRRPIRLQHVTVSAYAMDDVLGFYRDTLGMRVSDRIGHDFAWLRCGNEHHTIAVVNNSSPRLVDQFSFDFAGWQDFRDWGDRLACAGVDVSWGPGRHGPGNNLFIMFDDPDEYHVELSAEMELFYNDRVEYEPRVWQPSPRTVNLWGQVPPWRAATTAT